MNITSKLLVSRLFRTVKSPFTPAVRELGNTGRYIFRLPNRRLGCGPERVHLLNTAPFSASATNSNATKIVKLEAERDGVKAKREFVENLLKVKEGSRPKFIEKNTGYEGLASLNTQELNQKEISLSREISDLSAEIHDLRTVSSDIVGPNLVHIPDVLPFSAAIDDCSRPAFGKEACPVPQLVDVEPMITLAAKRVEDEMKKCTNLTNRVAPLVFSRFARGGKTTALCLLFDRLKKNNLNPIFISFNGSTGFKRREGETDCQAILRSIALQLIDLGERNPLNITCDEKELNAYLTKSLKPVVLIIDELNVLSVPVTADAGRMLRELFLDKENRYLVFSTHVPLDVDVRTDETPPTNTNVLMASPNVPPSPRLVHLATMPSCFDLTTLRAMSPACADLNPAEVAYFGGVPSLIYSVRMGDVDPKLRFSRVIKSSYFDENVPALKAFVDCVVTGKRSDLLPFFDQFGTVYRDRIRWPLCYIQCMLEVMPRNAGGNGVDFAQKCCESLRSDIGRTEKGLEWESIVNIALSFRCLQQSLSCTGSPFGVFKYGEKPLAMCVTMPGEIKTLQNARDFINEVINEKIEENEYVLLLVVPSYGKFPDSDGFVVTAKKLNDGTVREAMFPYQSKAGESYPSRKLPDGLVKGYLLRGKAPASAGLGKGWVYMSMNEVKDLLGVSLSPLYPLYWPVLPDAP